jgi:hypothetical protein
MKPSFLFYCGECPCSQVKKLKNSPRILFKGRKKEVKERLDFGKTNRKPRTQIEVLE